MGPDLETTRDNLIILMDIEDSNVHEPDCSLME